MVSETLADGLVSELSAAAAAIGIGQATLAAALADGQTIAQVARANGVKPRRVVTALVARAVADVAADIRRGDLSPDQVRWLVALATRRAEDQVTSEYPPIEFRPASVAAGHAPRESAG
jgi:F0F1-type ATP synthase membrane subunit c/vacuolar-type H+-ATPase subunit K